MNILAFSDWRVQPLDMILAIVDLHKPDVILYAGDDLTSFVASNRSLFVRTNHGFLEVGSQIPERISGSRNVHISPHVRDMLLQAFLPNNEALTKLGSRFYYVNGNDDELLHHERGYYICLGDGRFWVNGKDYELAWRGRGELTVKESPVRELTDATRCDFRIYARVYPTFGHLTVEQGLEKVSLFGMRCGYGLKSQIKNLPREYADIFLSHVPPRGVLDLSARFGIGHIGSRGLLDAIRKYRPKLVISGHSHMWGGFSAKVGETVVLNVSSDDRNPARGEYAVIDTADWSVEMKTYERREMRNIRGSRGVRRKVWKKLDQTGRLNRYSEADKGLEKLIRRWERGHGDFVAALRWAESLGVGTKALVERLESLKWEKPRITRRISLDPGHHAFVDVETGLAEGPNPGKLWLVGLWYRGRLEQFLMPGQKNEFLGFLENNRISSLVSWTQYDHKALRPLLKKARVRVSFKDACQRASNCCIWWTYRLDELHRGLLGDSVGENLIPGRIAGLYADHVILSKRRCPYCPTNAELVEQIKRRNEADIRGMIRVCEKLWNIRSEVLS